MMVLAIVLWSLGDVERARSLAKRAQKRSATVTHVGTHAYEKNLTAWIELLCGRHSRAAQSGVELADWRVSVICPCGERWG
jgi:hypothetical protein